MAQIIMSIRRGWWEDIAAGRKTDELRVSAPRFPICEEPLFVEVYVPERKGVCGSFYCRKIRTEDPSEELEKTSLVPLGFQQSYAKKRKLKVWHVEHVQTYEKPKPLSEYGLTRPPQSWGYLKGGKKD